MIAIKDTQPCINNPIVHHITAFLTLYLQIVFVLLFVAQARLDFYRILDFNTIMFASATHVFDKAWTNLIICITIVRSFSRLSATVIAIIIYCNYLCKSRCMIRPVYVGVFLTSHTYMQEQNIFIVGLSEILTKTITQVLF